MGWVSEYVSGKRTRSEGDPSLYGIGIDAAAFASIAGNHDHWNDGSWLGFPVFQEWLYTLGIFDRNPRVWRSSANGFRVEVYSVDSCSGIKTLVENSKANGCISSADLMRVEEQLNRADRSGMALRIIACHHSLLYNAPERPYRPECTDQFLTANRLDPASRRELEKGARRHKVAAILTGHIHRFDGPRSP